VNGVVTPAEDPKQEAFRRGYLYGYHLNDWTSPRLEPYRDRYDDPALHTVWVGGSLSGEYDFQGKLTP
jgi:hypothetical protein